jgi:hypothetical protein
MVQKAEEKSLACFSCGERCLTPLPSTPLRGLLATVLRAFSYCSIEGALHTVAARLTRRALGRPGQ